MKFLTILGTWAPLFTAVLAAELGAGGHTQITNLITNMNRPDGPPYVATLPKGAKFEDVVNQTTGNTVDIVYNVHNAGPAPICVFGRSTNLEDESSVEFVSEDTAGIPVQSNGTVQIRNIIPRGLGRKFNGAMHAREGCNEKCGECPSPAAVAFTLMEWTVSEDGRYWFDISLGRPSPLTQKKV
jgi:hypothetical protein